jgi:hypothetical protein
MDPFAALSVASNVVTFVEFTFNLVTESRKICKSAPGASENTILLQTIIRDVQQFNETLSASRHASQPLHNLVTGSTELAADLRNGLRALQAERRGSNWSSFMAPLDKYGQRTKLSLHPLDSGSFNLKFSRDEAGEGRVEGCFHHQRASSSLSSQELPSAISCDMPAVISAMSRLGEEASRSRSDQETASPRSLTLLISTSLTYALILVPPPYLTCTSRRTTFGANEFRLEKF